MRIKALDGPAYTDRDRLMFALGMEYQKAWKFTRSKSPDMYHAMIHAENEPIIRALCDDDGFKCRIRPSSNGLCHMEINPLPED